MKDVSIFLSYFFAITGFDRNNIYSIRHSTTRQRYILIHSLYQLGYNKTLISRIMQKSRKSIIDGLKNIEEEDKEYAKRIVTRWDEKMSQVSADITD